jgi:hypothetical protein
MKKLLLFVLLFANCLGGFTQTEFAPIGAEWYYNYDEGMGHYSGVGYYLLKSIKDTTIDSKECKVLSRTRVSSKGISFNDGQSIVYHDTKEKKIYRYLFGNFYLLYDFTRVAGDTIVIKEPYSASSYDSIVSVVDSVSIETLPNNIRLKVLYTQQISYGEYVFTDKTVENIGNLNYFFPFWLNGCDGGCPRPLRCYNEDKISFNLDRRPCDAVYPYTNIGVVNTIEISVFPNPFTNSFTIKNGIQFERQLSIDIYNLYGQSILHDVISGNMDNLINLNGYPLGFYYLVVKTGNKSITYKLVKK